MVLGVCFTVFIPCVWSVLYNTFKEKEKICGNGQGLRVHRDGFMSQEEHLQSLGVPALGSQAQGRWPWTGKVWVLEQVAGRADSWWRKEMRDARKSLSLGEVTIYTKAALP